MEKRGGSHPAYRKRWFEFIVHTRELHYFKGPRDKRPKGTIYLVRGYIVVPDPTQKLGCVSWLLL